MRGVTTCAAALALLACVGVRAHHSISMFDIGEPIWVKGTVISFQAVNPHVMVALERRGDGGQVQPWRVEGPGLNTFTRMGLGADFLQVGDVIEVCGFALKEEMRARTSERNARDAARLGIHGHVLIMPDRQMRLFGGYGKLENCVRPDDSPTAWLSFVNSDARAREAWCTSRVFANFPSLPSTAFVDEVNRLMTNPCPPLAQR